MRVQAAEWQDSEALLLEFSPLLDVAFLRATRERLTAAETAAGYRHRPSADEQQAIEARDERVNELLASADFSVDWEADLRAPYHQLIASSPAPAAEAMMTRVAELYLERAQATRAENRFAEATELVERGLVLHPGFAAFATERETIAEAAETLRRQLAEERRLARIADLKANLLAKASVDEPKEAKAVLGELAGELPSDDPFISSEGPAAIGGAYLRLAERVAERGDYDAARTLARAGLEVTQELEPLNAAEESYNRRLLELAADMQVLETAYAGGVVVAANGTPHLAVDPVAPASAAAVSSEARLIGRSFAGSSSVLAPLGAPLTMQVNDANPALGPAVARETAERIIALADSDGLDLAALGLPLRAFEALYPDSYPSLHQQAGERVAYRIGARADDAPLDVAALGGNHRRVCGSVSRPPGAVA